MSPPGPSVRIMTELNIKYYRNLLKNETNALKLQTIAKLLAEEEANLVKLLAQQDKDKEDKGRMN